MIGSGKPKTGRPRLGSYRNGRNKKLCIRISESDLSKLDKICRAFAITKSDFVIKAINDACSEVRDYGYNFGWSTGDRD